MVIQMYQPPPNLPQTIRVLQIAIINGPNLNLTGQRAPHIYGSESFDEKLLQWSNQFRPIAALHYFQSQVEGELIQYLHTCRQSMNGAVLNPGAYAHTSIALADAVDAIAIPVLEVHLSNIAAREPFRHRSFTAARCLGIISGLGMRGYELAIAFLCNHLSEPVPPQKVGNR